MLDVNTCHMYSEWVLKCTADGSQEPIVCPNRPNFINEERELSNLEICAK